MPLLLLVEDDPDQLTIRTLLFEHLGYTVAGAATSTEALALLSPDPPSLVVMDLRMPQAADGRALIQAIRARAPRTRIVVLSGWPADIENTPEAAQVEAVLSKPVRTRLLIETVARFAVLLFCLATAFAQNPHPIQFQLPSAAEVTLGLQMTAYGSDWSRRGSEAPCARLTTDGSQVQHVVLYAGRATRVYNVFLGELPAGWHSVAVERDKSCSAGFTRFELERQTVHATLPGDSDYSVLANAPILHARAGAIAKYTDLPLLLYATRARDAGLTLLEYTVVFSNEDGGTSTPSLMARWGRTADIEFVYRVWLDSSGLAARATIQEKDHQEVEFAGRYQGRHPMLVVSTENNMVAEGPLTGHRFQIVPAEFDLSNAARESALDRDPIAYRVAALELYREGKVREYEERDAEAISDPRNYLIVEARLRLRDARLQSLVRLRGKVRWIGSALDDPGNFVTRSGWVRMAIETPPHVRMEKVEEIAFECAPLADKPPGDCTVEQIGSVFFLDSNYKPLPSLFRQPLSKPLTIPAGRTEALPLK